MIRLFLAVAFCFLIMLSLSPAWADTDYACLYSCTNSGQPAHECLPKCDYAGATTTAEQKKNGINAHNTFSTLTPISDTTLLAHPALLQNGENMDHACLSQCELAGQQYMTCAPRCTKTPEFTRTLRTEYIGGISIQKVLAAPIDNHSILSLLPQNDPKVPMEDFACMSQCELDGTQFQSCENACPKPQSSSTQFGPNP